MNEGGQRSGKAGAERNRVSKEAGNKGRSMTGTEGRKEGRRLNQYIASCGLCSRREADRLIESGRVMINGVTASQGARVLADDEVTVDGKPVRGSQDKIVVAYYKPVGVTCTSKDPHAQRTLAEAFSYPVRLTYAGMMRGSYGHEKEYIVRVRSRISDADLERLKKGIRLPELDVKTRPCKIERLGDYTFRIILTQGLNRQIRRMCKAVGNEVKRLKRIRVLNVELGGMKPGEQRRVTGQELEDLYRIAGR